MSGFGTFARALKHEVKTLRGLLYRQIAANREDAQAVTQEFH
ncbi:MAG: hypothetical protein ACKOEC_18080 [Acidimicrobiia bacterium]